MIYCGEGLLTEITLEAHLSNFRLRHKLIDASFATDGFALLTFKVAMRAINVFDLVRSRIRLNFRTSTAFAAEIDVFTVDVTDFAFAVPIQWIRPKGFHLLSFHVNDGPWTPCEGGSVSRTL